jgi:competence protein ComEA
MLLVGAFLLGLYGWRIWFGPGGPGKATPIPEPVFVEMTGEVARPGVYAFPAPPTLSEVWRQAGGPEPAPASHLKLASGTTVAVDRQGHFTLRRMAGTQLLTLGLVLDLNTATREDLEALPGVGPVLAGRIVEHREAHGPFRQVDDLLGVPGIGPKKLEQLKPFLGLETGNASAPFSPPGR